ncbi:hypothetical protein SAMN05444169_3479 [Bradyrhizobium erythrophlei]|uniref:Uncharacterized protein n=1 Tax=Bradyrhizobium erythrophlei TaxID=1437360 RepID=A0A1M5LHP6_9BRAD|nr:hypothetical protein SAMN05444169_3479 [Bradyrhizobium erythrophlei]
MAVLAPPAFEGADHGKYRHRRAIILRSGGVVPFGRLSWRPLFELGSFRKGYSVAGVVSVAGFGPAWTVPSPLTKSSECGSMARRSNSACNSGRSPSPHKAAIEWNFRMVCSCVFAGTIGVLARRTTRLPSDDLQQNLKLGQPTRKSGGAEYVAAAYFAHRGAAGFASCKTGNKRTETARCHRITRMS